MRKSGEKTRLPCHCQSNLNSHSPERTIVYENLNQQLKKIKL